MYIFLHFSPIYVYKIRVMLELYESDEFTEEIKKDRISEMLNSVSLDSISSTHSIDFNDSLDSISSVALSHSSMEFEITIEEVSSDECNTDEAGLSRSSPEDLAIFGSDVMIGKLKTDKVMSVTSEGSDRLLSVLQEVKKVASMDKSGLCRNVILSAINCEITAAACSINEVGVLSADEKNGIITRMVSHIIENLKEFKDEVLEAGGRLMVMPPIPIPYQVDPKYSKNSVEVQKLLSRLYLKVHKEIKKFNTNNGQKTLNVSRFLEVKNVMRKKKKGQQKGKLRRNKVFYPDRDQRLIKTVMYKSDGIKLTEAAREKVGYIVIEKIEKMQSVVQATK